MTAHKMPWSPRYRIVGPLLLAMLAVLASSVLISVDARLAVLVLVGLAGPALLAYNWLWIPAITVLGLVALNDEGITPLKLLFFGAVFGIVAVSLYWLISQPDSSVTSLTRPLVYASFVLIALLGLSLVVALVNGTGIPAWARASTSYVLFTAAPFLGLLIWLTTNRRQLEWIFLISSWVGAASYMFFWAQARGFIVTPIPDLLFSSGGSFFALYYYALARVVLGRSGRIWILVLLLLVVGIFMTGSRTALVNILGFASIGFLGVTKGLRINVGHLGYLVSAIPLLLIGGIALAARGVIDFGSVLERYTSFGSFVSGGALDRSRIIREDLTRVAGDLIVDHPVLGTGPGFDIERYWIEAGAIPISASGVPRAPAILYDTPLVYPTLFGIVGLVALIPVALSYVTFPLRAPKLGGDAVASTAIQGWLITGLVTLPVAFTLDDKSLVFGVMFLIALALPPKGKSSGSRLIEKRERNGEISQHE